MPSSAGARYYVRHMTESVRLDASRLKAIDTHVHLESESAAGTAADAAAKKYFHAEGVARDPASIAAYYRERNMACVVFSVDERLTGRPPVPNDVVAQFAADNADVAIAFASIDPHRGDEGVREARRVVVAGIVRGLKLGTPGPQVFPNARLADPL